MNYGLNNLKVFLIFLVVMHHAALSYISVGGDWLVSDPNKCDALVIMLAVNASFFMGLFFFISGLFVPKSLKKLGFKRFISSKIRRLLIPVLLISFIGFPVYLWVFFSQVPSLKDYYFGYLSSGFTFGHSWFILQLFIFSFLFALFFFRRPFVNLSTFPQKYVVWAYIGLLSMTTWLVAQKFPIDVWVGAHFAEPFHLPQYISLFFLGCLVGEKTINQLSTKDGCHWGMTSLFLILLYIVNFNVGIGLARLEILWSCAVCVSISMALLSFFTTKFNTLSMLLQKMGEASYGIYIVHIFVVLLLQKVLLQFHISALAKFAVVTFLGYSLSFLIVYLWKLITTRQLQTR